MGTGSAGGTATTTTAASTPVDTGLYVSMAGITLELAGLAALHWGRLFP